MVFATCGEVCRRYQISFTPSCILLLPPVTRFGFRDRLHANCRVSSAQGSVDRTNEHTGLKDGGLSERKVVMVEDVEGTRPELEDETRSVSLAFLNIPMIEIQMPKLTKLLRP